MCGLGAALVHSADLSMLFGPLNIAMTNLFVFWGCICAVFTEFEVNSLLRHASL